MRILFIVNSPFLGGAEISALHLLRSLDTRMYDVWLVLPHDHKFPMKDIGSIKVVNLPLSWFTTSYNPLMLFVYCIKLLYVSIILSRIIRFNRIDVVYSHSVKSHAYGIMAKLASRRKAIWHIRDAGRLVGWKYMLAKYSDRIICVSDFVHLQSGKNVANKVTIHNGIDTEYFRNRFRERHLHIGEYTVSMVSQITKWKGIEDFIRVAKLVTTKKPNVSFILAGDSLGARDREYKAKILQMITEEHLTDDVIMPGWVDEIRDVYERTDVLVHTAIDEPFGRAVAEAMSMEIPVVAYRCGGPAEVIVDNVTGYLVEQYNYTSIAEKVIELLDSAEKRRLFGENGRKRIEQKFNLAQHVSSVKKVFHELA